MIKCFVNLSRVVVMICVSEMTVACVEEESDGSELEWDCQGEE